MSEYIGSHIALISKSDIKYVGTLHEINSENSTVALENVRSYGTEGRRQGQDEIPPSETVYEYIVFRGSDVKELSIVEAPKGNKPPAAVPNDPAILGSARPAQNQPQQYQQAPPPPHNQFPPPPNQFSGPPPSFHNFDPRQGPPQYPPGPRFQGPGGPHGFPGQPGAVPGYNPGYGPPPNFSSMGYGPPPGMYQQPHAFSPAPQNPIAPPGQRQPPQKTEQPQQAQKPQEMSGTPAPAAALSPAPPETKSVDTAQAAAIAAAVAEPKAAPKKAPSNRVAVPLAPKSQPKATPPKQAPSAPPQAHTDATQAATAAVAEAMAKLNPTTKPQTGMDNLAQKVNQMRVQDGSYSRGRGRGGAAPRGGRRDPREVSVPKEDFDFESSNAKFNKQDLAKEAASPLASPAANGDKENAFDTADADIVIPPKPTEKSYNKQTSFFDNISSDLKDRSEAQAFDGRQMRREERTRNVETFGQGSVDAAHRGGYRGRGRGQGRVRGQGFHRGGGDGTRGFNSRGRGHSETAAVLASTT